MVGVNLDGVINPQEVREMREWALANNRLAEKDPAFRELLSALTIALADNTIDGEELDDLRSLCHRAKANSVYFDALTHAIQELHGIIHGVLADLKINEEELRGLQDWIEEHEYLRQTWPVTEIESVVVKVLVDGKIDEPQRRMMLRYFAEFVPNGDIARKLLPVLPSELTIVGVCAVAPDVIFEKRVFCFTGISSKGTRKHFAQAAAKCGGFFVDLIRDELDYLVIGNEGNPCWAFACYGRKVERAVQMRRDGHRLLLIHERDFWDAAGQ